MYIHIFDACIIEKFSGSIDIYNVFGYRCKKKMAKIVYMCHYLLIIYGSNGLKETLTLFT